ncbi:HAD family hydrolase [Sinanaerobacter chloroacetimidivorans]|nr:HAD family hydrolase [Sinanaerobacter chloroacetimidivorans]
MMERNNGRINMQLKYDTVIFDLDGTLLNTLDDLADSVNTVLEQEGYMTRNLEEIRAFVGHGVKNLMEKSLPAETCEDEILRCLSSFRDYYLKNMLCKTRPYDGIEELLKSLKEKGIKTAVVSNKLDAATKEMCSFFFHGLINVAVGDMEGRKKKPAPDSVFEVLKQLDSKKEHTIFVGDSNTDVQTAKNAGLICVGVTWGFRSKEVLEEEGADYIIDRPEEFADLFRRLSKE